MTNKIETLKCTKCGKEIVVTLTQGKYNYIPTFCVSCKIKKSKV